MSAPVVPVASSVPGIATTEVAPVPPMVKSVVAPANAVNVVEGVVMLVVRSGEVARTGAPEPVAVVQTGRAVPPPTRISVVPPGVTTIVLLTSQELPSVPVTKIQTTHPDVPG